MKLRYFATARALRTGSTVIMRVPPSSGVGFRKRHAGRPSVTWPESVDEALSVGWIDGLRKRVDDDRYAIRFTPRKKGSIWSVININACAGTAAPGPGSPPSRPGTAAPPASG